jgi:hypothetical protein
MPSLAEAQQPRPDNYVPVERPSPPISSVSTQQNLTPGQNPHMRCPVPQTNFSSDARNQFYRGNTIPQFRTFSPPPLTSSTGTSAGGNTTSSSSSSTIVNNNTTNSVTLKPLMASLTTPVLNPGQTYTTSLAFSRMFGIIRVTATAAARVRVYATVQAQTSDLIRPTTQAPAYGTTQGLILDITMDTAPYNWLTTWLPVGANGDSPATPLAYVTVDQIAAMSGPVTVSFSYLPLES